jgi:hypothetical protein
MIMTTDLIDALLDHMANELENDYTEEGIYIGIHILRLNSLRESLLRQDKDPAWETNEEQGELTDRAARLYVEMLNLGVFSLTGDDDANAHG